MQSNYYISEFRRNRRSYLRALSICSVTALSAGGICHLIGVRTDLCFAVAFIIILPTIKSYKKVISPVCPECGRLICRKGITIDPIRDSCLHCGWTLKKFPKTPQPIKTEKQKSACESLGFLLARYAETPYCRCRMTSEITGRGHSLRICLGFQRCP